MPKKDSPDEPLDEIRVERTHNGNAHGEFVGLNRRSDRHLQIRSRHDRRFHQLDKALLLPEGLWDFHELVQATAEAAGISYQQALDFARGVIPERLQRTSSGPLSPDPTETGDASHRGPGQRRAA